MPVIVKPSDYFNVLTYTGTGATQTISGLTFQPDWVWIKSRSGATDHKLTDAVRGATKSLESNTTDAEATDSNGITAFTSTGFTLGSDSVYNNNGSTYVAWCWKANGSGVTNTAGSITSTVSANTTAGFSIVTYTGTGANATVGHGLGVAPSMVIVKQRSSPTASWRVYHQAIGNTGAVYLNTTVATETNSIFWNNTSPTSTTFSLGTDGGVNGSTNTYVAYCFAPVAGYSAFGSYVGNGSADGPFIYTGFRPRFILIKASSFSTASTVWTLFDTSRSPYNAAVNELYANSSSAEGVDSSGIDILSNGFKPKRNSEYANSNGQTYIYMAFAEHPFKYANAR